MTLWVRRGFKQDSGKRVSLFIVLREYHLMKGPDNEAIFSVVCSSDILEQHDISACDIFSKFGFYKQFDLEMTSCLVICTGQHSNGVKRSGMGRMV